MPAKAKEREAAADATATPEEMVQFSAPDTGITCEKAFARHRRRFQLAKDLRVDPKTSNSAK